MKDTGGYCWSFVRLVFNLGQTPPPLSSLAPLTIYPCVWQLEILTLVSPQKVVVAEVSNRDNTWVGQTWDPARVVTKALSNPGYATVSQD